MLFCFTLGLIFLIFYRYSQSISQWHLRTLRKETGDSSRLKLESFQHAEHWLSVFDIYKRRNREGNIAAGSRLKLWILIFCHFDEEEGKVFRIINVFTPSPESTTPCSLFSCLIYRQNSSQSQQAIFSPLILKKFNWKIFCCWNSKIDKTFISARFHPRLSWITCQTAREHLPVENFLVRRCREIKFYELFIRRGWSEITKWAIYLVLADARGEQTWKRFGKMLIFPGSLCNSEKFSFLLIWKSNVNTKPFNI